MCLFDWCRLARVSRKISVTDEENLRAVDDSTLNENSDDLQDNEFTIDSIESSDHIGNHIQSDNEDELTAAQTYRQKLKMFIDGHPLCTVKGVHCVQDDKMIVPCFAGGTLP